MTEKEMVKEFIKCKLDGYYFIITYCKTIDNETGDIKPLPDYPYLRKLFNELESGINLCRKKSRRMVVSWFLMAYELWCIQFKDVWSGFNLSYKEDLVDDHTPNSLHGKIKYMHEQLPEYLKMKIEFPYMKVNCSNKNYIIGESSNPDAARGGGYSFGFIDEAAFIRFAESIYAAFCRAAKQKVMVSTANGKSTMFARVSKLAVEDPTAGWNYEFLHARLRPDRTNEYFEQARKEMTALQYAREIDGDDTDSTAGRVWVEFDYQKHVVKDLNNPNTPLELSFDFGFADPTAIKFVQNVDGTCSVVGELEATRCTPEQVINLIIDKLVDLKRLKSFAESGYTLQEYKQYTRKYLKELTAYGDPAGNNETQDGGGSLIKQYADFGLHIKTTGKSNVFLGILEVSKRLNKNKLYIDQNCVKTIDEINNCHYKVNERTGEILDTQKYEHDDLSHGADALRYWCENNPLKVEGKTPPPKRLELTRKQYFKSGRS